MEAAEGLAIGRWLCILKENFITAHRNWPAITNRSGASCRIISIHSRINLRHTMLIITISHYDAISYPPQRRKLGSTFPLRRCGVQGVADHILAMENGATHMLYPRLIQRTRLLQLLAICFITTLTLHLLHQRQIQKVRQLPSAASIDYSKNKEIVMAKVLDKSPCAVVVYSQWYTLHKRWLSGLWWRWFACMVTLY